MTKIKIGILGYGNLGRGVEQAIRQNPDMELAGIFTRRDPSELKPVFSESKVYNVNDAVGMKDDIDVMILCGGSATDLIVQSPEMVKNFNIVDSFDTHARIPEHFKNVNEVAKAAGKVGIISVGWDPGLFSVNRLYAGAVLPQGKDYTFWGKGVSQGHSDAVRRVEGVAYAIQYTIPVESAVDAVRSGVGPEFTTREKHKRECFVVAKEGADLESIRSTIVNMPNYFSDYDTVVNFISEEEFKANHTGMPHGGFVMRSGVTGKDGQNKQFYEFSLKLDSNPEFTSSVLVAYARAAYRLSKAGSTGAKTIFDIAPKNIAIEPVENLIRDLL